MSQLAALKDSLKDYAKDIRLNLSTMLSQESGAPGLTPQQLWGTALACAYASKESRLVVAIASDSANTLSLAEREAAKAAATVMAMNNVYYRSLHLLEDPELAKLPARLRMNVIGSPGIAKVDFELYCLGISALAGCGSCLKAHQREVEKAGISKEGVQSVLRLSAVVNAVSQALAIG